MITRDRIAGNFAICDPVKQMANKANCRTYIMTILVVCFSPYMAEPSSNRLSFKDVEKAHFHQSKRTSIMNNLRI